MYFKFKKNNYTMQKNHYILEAGNILFLHVELLKQ